MIRGRKLLSSSNGLNFVHKITYKPFIVFYQHLLPWFIMSFLWVQNGINGLEEHRRVMFPRRDDIRKKCAALAAFDALSHWSTGSFLSQLWSGNVQRISINAPMCDRLILLTSVPSEMMLHLLGNRKMWHEWGGRGHSSVTERKELLLLRTGHPGFIFLCE